MSSSNDQVLVWDWPVRVMHWCLVLSVFGAWLTHELEGDWFAWHVRFGYAVLVVTVVRLVWGFVGTRHARFVAFVRVRGRFWVICGHCGNAMRRARSVIRQLEHG